MTKIIFANNDKILTSTLNKFKRSGISEVLVLEDINANNQLIGVSQKTPVIWKIKSGRWQQVLSAEVIVDDENFISIISLDIESNNIWELLLSSEIYPGGLVYRYISRVCDLRNEPTKFDDFEIVINDQWGTNMEDDE